MKHLLLTKIAAVVLVGVVKEGNRAVAHDAMRHSYAAYYHFVMYSDGDLTPKNLSHPTSRCSGRLKQYRC